MADLCEDCQIELFGTGDLKDVCEEGQCVYIHCDNCGLILVNHNGERIDEGDKDDYPCC